MTDGALPLAKRLLRGIYLGIALGALGGSGLLVWSAASRLSVDCAQLSELECGLARHLAREMARWQLLSAAALLLLSAALFLVYRWQARAGAAGQDSLPPPAPPG